MSGRCHLLGSDDVLIQGPYTGCAEAGSNGARAKGAVCDFAKQLEEFRLCYWPTKLPLKADTVFSPSAFLVTQMLQHQDPEAHACSAVDRE